MSKKKGGWVSGVRDVEVKFWVGDGDDNDFYLHLGDGSPAALAKKLRALADFVEKNSNETICFE